jgi:hypothetical protein
MESWEGGETDRQTERDTDRQMDRQNESKAEEKARVHRMVVSQGKDTMAW